MNPPRRTNGSPVTRAELGAHLERIDERLEAIKVKVDEIAQAVAAPRRWFNARLTAVVDRGLIVAASATVSATLAYLATHG